MSDLDKAKKDMDDFIEEMEKIQKAKIDQMAKDVEALHKALSAGLPTIDPVSSALLDTLHRLDLPKSKRLAYGGVLKVEELDAILKGVTFDDSKINLWPSINKRKK